MKITGKLITEIEVDHKDLAKALKRAIFVELDLPRYNKVHHDGVSFIETVDAHTSHRFEYERPVKPACQEDIEVFEAFNTIKEFLDTV
jgi:hypothetical protein|tara:strand:- start:733 stop:996 length:264 start_codon:yes stop_codon:yes gene_type:complete